MLNAVWLGMLLIGIAVAAVNGRVEVVSQAALNSSQAAVTICLELVGIMTMWLGLLKIAEKSGLVELLARAVKPITNLLFPSIPSGHPALGAIIMNISANILGLGNAATPFGLKAMEEMQALNRRSETASDAMCTFLAINTSCITLIPATIIGVRVGANSANPTEIVGPTILATACAMVVAITADAILRHFYHRRRRY
ncbi:MAG: spore maturation protein [Syntrophomonadaceae bacterium]|nr:spore maturation protein [Syntrophomonadaceae bacterium]